MSSRVVERPLLGLSQGWLKEEDIRGHCGEKARKEVGAVPALPPISCGALSNVSRYQPHGLHGVIGSIRREGLAGGSRSKSMGISVCQAVTLLQGIDCGLDPLLSFSYPQWGCSNKVC